MRVRKLSDFLLRSICFSAAKREPYPSSTQASCFRRRWHCSGNAEQTVILNNDYTKNLLAISPTPHPPSLAWYGAAEWTAPFSPLLHFVNDKAFRACLDPCFRPCALQRCRGIAEKRCTLGFWGGEARACNGSRGLLGRWFVSCLCLGSSLFNSLGAALYKSIATTAARIDLIDYTFALSSLAQRRAARAPALVHCDASFSNSAKATKARLQTISTWMQGEPCFGSSPWLKGAAR